MTPHELYSAAKHGPIPPPLSNMEKYPNLLEITAKERESFFPVVRFPVDDKTKKPVFSIIDFTTNDSVESSNAQLVTEEQREGAQRDGFSSLTKSRDYYTLGRYDENRVGLYESDMFHNTEYQIDGFAGRRTVHIGIDLGGPVQTPIYAFTDGVVHAAGYNPELGDYGNVIVLKHILPGDSSPKPVRCLYALYGHLSHASIEGKPVGHEIKGGALLGHMGDIHENGGWSSPHVHFQLSLSPPSTHDMPGAVSLEDRPKALFEYPDPRLVLGPLY